MGGMDQGDDVIEERRSGTDRRGQKDRRSDRESRGKRVKRAPSEDLGDDLTIPDEQWDRRSGIDRRGHPFYRPPESNTRQDREESLLFD